MLNGHFSHPANVSLGVFQGTILASLCLCYIYDLPEGVKSTIKIYADYILMCASILYSIADPLQTWLKVTNAFLFT